MGEDVVIFNIKYVPYKLKKGSTKAQISKHQEERRFYSMVDNDKSILNYMTKEGKVAEKETSTNYTILKYLEKNTGVFNQKGLITKKELEEMKERVKKNEGNIWSGFISLSENDSPKIDTIDKCVKLVKKVFNSFFEDAEIIKSNIDLMCSLHIDRPHHLHIHFCFWEKEPIYYDKNKKEFRYRPKGKIHPEAISKAKVNVARFIYESNYDCYSRRDEALKELKSLTRFRNINASKEEILEEIISLKIDLPKEGRLSYGSENMKPYRERIDNIVRMLLINDDKASESNVKFYENLERQRRTVKEKSKGDKNELKVFDTIMEDYKTRQGNMIINLVKAIEPEYYERSKKWKYKVNDHNLKRRLAISKRKVNKIFTSFLEMLSLNYFELERDFSNRLQVVEEEMKEQEQIAKGEYEMEYKRWLRNQNYK